MTTYRLFPATNGPATVAGASGGWLLGVIFSVTGGMRWLDGYFHWVPNNGDTTPRKFALWNRYSTSAQNLVPDSVVTSGTMTLGAWNFVALPNPIQLAPGALYVAAVGWTVTTGIPVTGSQWGSGDPLSAGIINGPLTGWSAQSGSNAFPASTGNYNLGQGLFSNVLGSDPSINMPNNGSGDDNLWVDVLIDDTAPAGFSGSYRIWPNMGDLGNFFLDTANGFTLSTEFSLSLTCTVNKVWFYSPATVSVLPTQVGVYRVSDQTLVLSNSSPSWSGAAGSGWISTPLTGTLASGTNYKVVVFQGANIIWNAAVANYWGTGPPPGFGVNGLTAGPITVPNNATATPGQESYHQAGVISYPDTNVGPYHYGTDIEVTPGVPHTATATLAVAPSFTAHATRGHYRTATLTVTPSFTATARTAPTAVFWAGEARGKWVTGGLSMYSQSVLSTQYVQIPITVQAPAAYDPTGDTVQFAFTPLTYPVTEPTVWATGSWVTFPGPAYRAQCLVGPGGTALTIGTYQVWVKITDSPEVPVLQPSTLVITP